MAGVDPKAGGVDSKPIGGFKDAMAAYQKRASGSNKDAAATSKATESGGDGGGKNALFASINKGGDTGTLTKGLNKVTKDMKTKNRKDRSGKVPAASDKNKKTPSYKSKQESKEKEKDPEIKELGGTIRVSYYKNMEKLMIFGSSADDTDEKKIDPYTPEDMKIYNDNKISLKNEVEFWNCEKGMFRVSKKCKAVKLYNCKNCQVVVRSVLSTIEVTNCNRCSLFVKEKAPSLVLEKCDGVKLWLDEAAAKCDPPPQLYTTLAQNTELSVGQGEEKDPLSVPVPSQFVTTIENGKWQTKPVEHV